MLITILSILSFLSLYIINTIILYKLYKEIREYRLSMFESAEEYEHEFNNMQFTEDVQMIAEPEYTYDNPPKTVNNLFDVDAYRKRMDAMKKEQEEDGLYDIKDEGAIVNDIYFTGVEEPED